MIQNAILNTNLINYKNFKNQTFEFMCKCFDQMALEKPIFLMLYNIFRLAKAISIQSYHRNVEGEDFFVVDGRYSKDLKKKNYSVTKKRRKERNVIQNLTTALAIILDYYNFAIISPRS